MTERNLNEQRWLQQLIAYAKEKYFVEQNESWEAFLRDYGYFDIWKDSYYDGETPQDALETELSYWEK